MLPVGQAAIKLYYRIEIFLRHVYNKCNVAMT